MLKAVSGKPGTDVKTGNIARLSKNWVRVGCDFVQPGELSDDTRVFQERQAINGAFQRFPMKFFINGVRFAWFFVMVGHANEQPRRIGMKIERCREFDDKRMIARDFGNFVRIEKLATE